MPCQKRSTHCCNSYKPMLLPVNEAINQSDKELHDAADSPHICGHGWATAQGNHCMEQSCDSAQSLWTVPCGGSPAQAHDAALRAQEATQKLLSHAVCCLLVLPRACQSRKGDSYFLQVAHNRSGTRFTTKSISSSAKQLAVPLLLGPVGKGKARPCKHKDNERWHSVQAGCANWMRALPAAAFQLREVTAAAKVCKLGGGRKACSASWIHHILQQHIVSLDAANTHKVKSLRLPQKERWLPIRNISTPILDRGCRPPFEKHGGGGFQRAWPLKAGSMQCASWFECAPDLGFRVCCGDVWQATLVLW